MSSRCSESFGSEAGEESATKGGCRAGHRVEQVACGSGGGGVGEEGVERSGFEEVREVGRQVGVEEAGLHWRRIGWPGPAGGLDRRR